MSSPHAGSPAGSGWVRIIATFALALGSPLAGGSVLAAPPLQQEMAAIVAALPPVALDYCVEDEEVAFLSLINNYRTQNGLGPLEISQTLGAAAATHSDHMAVTSYFDHTMSDGTTVAQNIRNHGYAGSTYGENIAAGVELAESAFSTFQGSASHNANMLQGNYESIGIARSYDPASGYGWYWTIIFGGDLDLPAAVCGQTPPWEQLLLASSDGDASAAETLNLRTGPGQEYEVLTEIPEGSAMAVDGVTENGYLPVTFRGFTGWVAEDYVLRELTAMQPAAAPASTATTTDSLNLRAGPSEADPILLTIPQGEQVTLTGAADAGYLGVSFSGTQGWANAAYLAIADSSTAPAGELSSFTPGEPVATETGGVMATANLNLRAGPGPDTAILSVVPRGTRIELTGEPETNGYVGVLYNGIAGWVDAEYLG